MELSYLSSILVLATLSVLETQAEKIVFCYYGSWAVYRTGNGKFTVSDIDPNLCTHVGYTFFGVNDDGSVKSLDTWADLPDGLNGLGQLEELKKVNPKLKTSLVVGGWNERATKYSNIAKDPAKMQRFIDTALELIKKYNFNGLDLDWEYPAHADQGGDLKVDKANFVTFVTKIKAALRPKNLAFTAAVAAPEATAVNSYDIAAISKQLDFIHIMTYDLHGNWDKKTGLHTALKDPSNPKLSVEGTVDYWLKSGCPPKKLVLGLATYGQSFTLSNPSQHGVNAPAPSGGNAGPYTKQGGFLGYNEICEKLKNKELTEVFDENMKVPYAFKGNQWVGYDNAKSIELKTEFALKKGLAGVMIWSIETDDFKGICGEKFPLLKAMNRGLKKDVKPDPPVITTAAPITTTTTASSGGSNSGSSGPFVCPGDGTFKDPANCSKYYVCMGTTAQSMECPTGLNFNPSLNICDWPANVVC